MATIDDIIAKLQTIPIQNGSLVLNASDFDIDFVNTFFTQVVGADTLVFENASTDPGTGSFTVTGQGEHLGYTGITLTLTFTTQDDQVVATLDGTFDKGKIFPLPVLTWLSISNAGITTTLSQPYNIVNFIFHADIQDSANSIPGIPIEIGSVDPDNWRIDIAGASTQPVTAEQLVTLLSGNTLDSFVPDSLVQLLDGLAINDFQVIFNTTDKTVGQFYVGLSTTNGWPIITSKVVIDPGLSLALTMTNPTDATTRETVGQVTGTFDVDGVSVPVFVQADVSSNSTNWIVGLNPNSTGVTLPSFSSLIALAGGDSFVATLPSGLKDIPQINISKLQVDFSLSPAALQLLTFAASTTSSWPIIDGFLTIEDLWFALDLLNLTSQSPQIGGQIGSTFTISNTVSLYFAIQKDPASADWIFSGGLPPGQSLNLTDLVTKLLSSFVTVPANAPVITFNTLNTTVTPGSSMSFTAGSTSTWSLVTNELEVESFILQFNYNELATQNKFSGSLAASITIAKVTLNLVTSLDTSGTWNFAGSTAAGQTVQIGDLIADLATKFGIPDVPGPIESLDLTSLDVTYDSGTGDFGFNCTGNFEVSDTQVTLLINISVTKTQTGDQNKQGTIVGNQGYSATFTGQVTFAGLTFTLVFNTQDTSTDIFVASYSAASGPAGTINLHDLVADVSSSLAASIPTDLAIDLQTVKFIFLQQNSVKQFSFGLDLSTSISLADIPLVGDKLPNDVTLAIRDLQFTYNSLAFTTGQVNIINPILPSSVSQLPGSGLPQGMILAADLQLGQDPPQHLAIGGDTTSSQTPAPPSGQTAARVSTLPSPAGDPNASATPNTKWFDIQKQFGIFQFNRIGISYQSGVILFSLDAGMNLGPLTFTLNGLSIGSEISKFDPQFDILGLGLGYSSPPILIAGGLLKVAGDELSPGVKFQFDGSAVVEAENFGLAAIGSYAQLNNGDPSLFVYAQLEVPLGGPPAFFITGLMFGFGFNRSLAIPAQNQVASFPLLLLAQPPGPGQPAQSQSPEFVLQVLEGQAAAGGVQQAWIQPQPGSYWIAAGLQFTSFELVTSNALLIVEFGNDFQVALLGLSTLRLPQDAPNAETYAYLELQLMAVFRPQDGFFGLTAVLTSNSYVIAPACHITGGFAFYIWFGSNPNAGQFVITLGGYHPAFTPPSYFPQEPRLGFNWAVSSQVSIQGDAYFALTTSCVMAGGGLQVLFQDGNLRAWYTAQADFLLSWNPFFFTAQIQVDIGVSYRMNLLFCHKTISVSIGASIDMWGPPTGGYVHVHLVVVSFTVSFGSSSAGQNNNPLAWSDFKSLIPSPSDVCKIMLSSGMYKSQDDPGGLSTSGKLWIVRATDFAFFTQSAIPASNLQTGSTNSVPASVDAIPASPTANVINIRPMNLSGVTSTHNLSLYSSSGGTGNQTWNPEDTSNWDLQPRYQNVPDSLWGTPPTPFTQMPAAPSANVIPNQIVGYAATAPLPQIGNSRGVVPLTALAQEMIIPAGAAPLSSAVTASPDYVPAFNDTTVAQIEQVMQTTVQQNRDAIYNALKSTGLYSNYNGSLSAMAANANSIFSDSPLQQS